MLKLDRNKMQYLSANTAAPFSMLRGYKSARAGMDRYHGLGLNLNDIEAANQFNPEPISHAAIQVISSIQRFFGIGQGRMEADQIVPIQNDIHYNVLAPIAEAVNASYKNALSRSQLQAMLDALLTTEENWLAFLHNTEWTDGRAAVQAEQTLEFLFRDQEHKIRTLLPNAPYFSNVEPPPYIPYVPGGSTTTRPGGYPPITTGGVSPVVRATSNYLPWILAGAFLFMLPKVGKR